MTRRGFIPRPISKTAAEAAAFAFISFFCSRSGGKSSPMRETIFRTIRRVGPAVSRTTGRKGRPPGVPSRKQDT